MPVIVQHSRTSSTSSNFASPQPPAPPAYHDLQRQFNGCQINASLFVPEESQGGDVEKREVDDEGDEERVMGTEGWAVNQCCLGYFFFFFFGLFFVFGYFNFFLPFFTFSTFISLFSLFSLFFTFSANPFS